MKQAVSILLSVLYLLGTLHLSVDFHHCGGKLKYVKVENLQEDKVCCKAEGGHCCCTDKEVKYDVDDQQVAKTFFAKAKSFSDDYTVEYPVLNLFSSITYPIIKVYKVSHSPPLITNLRRHILHCTYLI